jgi:hypothetical protein
MITYIEAGATMKPDQVVESNGMEFVIQTMLPDEYNAIQEEFDRSEIGSFDAKDGEFVNIYRVLGYTILNVQVMMSNADSILLLGHPDVGEIITWYNTTSQWNTEEVVEFIQEHVGPKPTTH